jgi:AcrR family transcriptional regulator
MWKVERSKGTTLRRDAQERRERLIQAAVELYASDGFEVPLERIAERADVSRPTLYRNFPTREAVTIAVMHVHIDDLAQQVAQWAGRDDAFLLGLRLLAVKTLASGGLGKIVSVHRQTPSSVHGFRSGVERILTDPLERAKKAGLVRDSFEIGDTHRAVLMIAGGGLGSHGDNVAVSVEEALNLLLLGLAPVGNRPK